MSDPKDDLLDDIFATARKAEPKPTVGLMARVLADAAAVQPAATTAIGAKDRVSWFSGLMGALGGWPALSGVAAAGVAGLWLGISPPASVEDWAASAMGTTTAVSFLGDYDVIDAWEAADG